jgi:hypothetical protein
LPSAVSPPLVNHLILGNYIMSPDMSDEEAASHLTRRSRVTD